MMTRWKDVGVALLSLASLSTCVHTFAPPRSSSAVRPASGKSFVGDGRRIIVGLPQQPFGTELHLFRRLLRREGRGNSTKSEDDNENSNKESGLPFFAASNENVSDNGDDSTEVLAVASTITTAIPTEEKMAPPEPEEKMEPPGPEEELDPIVKALAEAKALKASAQRVRLEAERLDARLTLEKITKLEKELGSNSIMNKPDRASEIRNQMELLQRKLRGEPATPPTTLISKSVGDVTKVSSDINTERILSESLLGQTNKNVKTLDALELAKRVEEFQNAPAFFRNVVAKSAGMNPESLNATTLILKLYQDEQLGSASAIEGIFTPSGRKQISDEVNATSVARDMFNKGYEAGLEGAEDARQPYDAFFPTLRKNEDKAPSLQDVNSFLSEVLAKSNGAFQPSESPMQIKGGYVIRGTSRFDNGTQVMDAIEEKLESFPRLRDALTISYVTDVFIPNIAMDGGGEDFDMEAFVAGTPVILVSGGPETRERTTSGRVVRTLVTSAGLATSWYLAIYPFFLNPKLLARAEEAISLADSNMNYDTSWLSELSLPLFLSFLSIQLSHELAHRAVAANYGFNITLPTFYPSVATGLTATSTSFKSPPKDNTELFDFAIAGPLVGMIFSLVALAVGMNWTLYSDASFLPALPLTFLRQSSLAGGIIESVLGAGALYVPAGADIASVASINISMHPLAITGFVGMLINALALIPYGSTDGGLVGVALFGRPTFWTVSLLTSLAMLISAFLGSDLLLFYFAYMVFFQSDMVIPLRNEIDDISFSRVLLAIASGVLVCLTLTPMG